MPVTPNNGGVQPIHRILLVHPSDGIALPTRYEPLQGSTQAIVSLAQPVGTVFVVLLPEAVAQQVGTNAGRILYSEEHQQFHGLFVWRARWRPHELTFV